MRKKTTVLLSSFLSLALGLAAFAAEKSKDAPAKSAPVNKKCPVEGGDVDASETVVYKGKTVGFCCGGCDTEFKKDPEKYMKVLADKGDDSTIKKDAK